jgi:hypothetical protein
MNLDQGRDSETRFAEYVAGLGSVIIPPSGPRSAAPVQVPPLPDNYRPRGSALAA